MSQNKNDDTVSMVSKFSELYKLSADRSSVETYNISQQFYKAYRECEIFKFEPKKGEDV